MAKNEILGVAKCHVCECRGRTGRARIKRNVNLRIYSHCDNSDCRTEIRYEPDGAYRPEDVPGYIGPFEVAPLRNVTGPDASLRNVTEPDKPVTKTEPVDMPAPVVKPKKVEAVYGYDW